MTDRSSQSTPHFQQPSAKNLSSEPHTLIQDWRTDVLNRLLPIIAIMMLPALIAAIEQALRAPEAEPLGVIFLIIFYGALLTLTFFRKLGTWRRCLGLILLMYLTGVVALARGGLAGDGRTYLIALTVLSIFLLNIRAGIFFSVLSMLTYVLFSFLAQSGALQPWLVYKTNPLEMQDWVINGLTLATLIGVMLFISHRSTSFQFLTLQSAQRTAGKLEKANQLLEEANLNLEKMVAQRTQELSEANLRLARLAMHDALTGLPNRALLYERLNQAIEQSQQHRQRFALLFIDLDNFKTINDTHGHEIGDHLLVAIAHFLQNIIGVSDTVARLGGDEFVIILNNLQTQPKVESTTQALVDFFARPMLVDNIPMHASASIGISFYPDHGLDPETLLQKADAAMYAVKGASKNGFEIFKGSAAPPPAGYN